MENKGWEIGRKVVLHKHAFPDLLHDTPDEFVTVTTTEKELFPNMWGEGTGWGYKGVGDDGRTYTTCWGSYPDDSMTPYWSWFCEGAAESWYDITYVRNACGLPPTLRDSEVVGYCPMHKRIFNKESGKGECFDCYMDRKYPNREALKKRKQQEALEKAGLTKAKWNGWTGSGDSLSPRDGPETREQEQDNRHRPCPWGCE